MPKFPSIVKVINIKISYYIMDLEGAFLDLEGALLPSFAKSGGHGPSGPPGSYIPVYMWNYIQN